MNKQKTRTFRRVLAVILSLALLLSVTPITTAFAAVDDAAVGSLPGNGTEKNPYTIGSDDDWDEFCNILMNNQKGVFNDTVVRLERDITVDAAAGSSGHDFTGTFDGDGHTLTFEYNGDGEYAAPFRYVEDGCVIKKPSR